MKTFDIISSSNTVIGVRTFIPILGDIIGWEKQKVFQIQILNLKSKTNIFQPKKEMLNNMKETTTDE